eukprot:gnl/MRDRNA2_/MRDRNA2_28285_c0_seq1.p1 gnl/MRDRNA2_/MRDRNA2_28285_c0~~gnl/MRDRNA2_/MRDRNA2_28285_c0_seq1.p1  ORF type:complete len:186 (-),score=26.50 gnl/MRDRNA2_/MRDRNA2_28285_c0_seq1:44-601(-)
MPLEVVISSVAASKVPCFTAAVSRSIPWIFALNWNPMDAFVSLNDKSKEKQELGDHNCEAHAPTRITTTIGAMMLLSPAWPLPSGMPVVLCGIGPAAMEFPISELQGLAEPENVITLVGEGVEVIKSHADVLGVAAMHPLRHTALVVASGISLMSFVVITGGMIMYIRATTRSNRESRGNTNDPF